VTIGGEFIQLLAKIGYAFAVGVTGSVRRQSSPIPALILNGTGLGTWVGSQTFDLWAENRGATHALAHNPSVPTNTGEAEVVRLKMFAASRAPNGYEVVTHAAEWQKYSGIGGFGTLLRGRADPQASGSVCPVASFAHRRQKLLAADDGNSAPISAISNARPIAAFSPRPWPHHRLG